MSAFEARSKKKYLTNKTSKKFILHLHNYASNLIERINLFPP